MPSPAERFAASQRRQAEAATELSRFQATYPFTLDPFQLDACRALEDGHGVLVAAPTGSGKTVVGEFAVHLALAAGRKCFYTTPIKALSNQKFADLARTYGADQVGLLTGDNSINGEARVVVMTTEVLRNMLYAGSATLADLGYVVMDEVHYLADRFRGAVWEEVIIHLAESVQLVSLSATVSNAEEFGDWLDTVRGDTTVIVEEHRPVPLWQHVLVRNQLWDLFTDEGRVNPELVRLSRDEQRYDRVGDRRPQRGGRRPRPRDLPSRADVIERLDREGLLPAITFIFSRAGCDASVLQCMRSGLRLTTAEEREEIRRFVEDRCSGIPDEDLHILGYHEWLEGLMRGIAAHHAGMLPTFKEVVEELFVRGLVRAVFATETLALGINMPARSVVLEKLTKWNGETHADVTPGEYTQLTGRAGRRGIDVEGHAVVVWQPGLDPRAVAGLASTRTYPLRSSFRPSYNMAVNLTGQVGRDRARAILESSFAQFQADRAVVGLARQVTRNNEGLEGYRASMTCHLGDFEAYARLRRTLKDRESELARSGSAQRRAAAVQSLEKLKPGDVIRIPSGRSAGLAVVLESGLQQGSGDGPRPYVLTQERQARRLSVVDFPSPVEPLERLRIPKSFNPRDPRARRDLASTLRAAVPQGSGKRPARGRAAAADDAEITHLRTEIRAHPCHGCAEREDHARWAERYWRLRRENDQLRHRVDNRTNSIARQFDRVCEVLETLGYLEGDRVTPEGVRLARLYTELDLVAAECLRRGLWDDLAPAELAACVSALVFESRQPDDAAPPRLPGGRTQPVLAAMVHAWGELAELESTHQLDHLREMDTGFAWATWQWASGARLEVVLEEGDLTAGDFVRWVKQVLDLLDQVAQASDGRLRAAADAAGQAMRRGVVSYSSVG
ncbi:MAG TPA: DEAD/DEAH box helicase [Candidatus Limnocylindria bacterium]|nr:DEAD/DEAH box helicase [Candidatus Limnocylindria bacterium]